MQYLKIIIAITASNQNIIQTAQKTKKHLKDVYLKDDKTSLNHFLDVFLGNMCCPETIISAR